MLFALWFVVVSLGAWMWMRVNHHLLGDSLSPLNLLLFSWLGPLSLALLSLSGLQRPWSPGVWMVLGWCTVALVGVSAAVATRLPRKPLFAGVEIRGVHEEWRSPQLLIVVSLLYGLGFAAYLYSEFITNPVGIPAISYLTDPSLSREGWHRWGKGGGTTVAGLLASLVPMLLPSLYLVSHGAKSPMVRRVLWIAVAAYPLMALLKLSRIDTITSVVGIGMAEYYRRAATRGIRQRGARSRSRTLRIRLLIVAALVAAAPFSTFFLKLRANVDAAQTYFDDTLDLRFGVPVALQGLVLEGYSYFAIPFENLADWVPGYTGPNLPGVGSLRPVYSLLGRGRDMDDLQESAIGYYRLTPINTYPFVTLPFFEYGALSVALYPIFVALLTNLFYLRMRVAPTALSMVLYLNCMYGWLLLFSANGFAVLTFYLNIAGLTAVYTAARVLRAVSSASDGVGTESHARA